MMMFGYLQPQKEELKVKEWVLYKSVYCGLCQYLGQYYGILSRLTLSYDCTVLAMLYMSLHSEQYCIKKKHCVVNPLKKCLFCQCRNDSFRFAGAVSVIMTYYKLTDTIEDSGFLKKTGASILKLLFRRNYRKAVKAYPEINDKVAVMMEEQRQAEQNNSDIDRAAEPTAHLVSDLCTVISPGDEQKRILGVFGYFVGRWIYIMDAADDLEKDMKHQNFNPFQKIHSGEIAATMEYCNQVLNMTASHLAMAYDLIELTEFKEILDNIVYNGLPCRQKRILFDKYQKKRKEV